MFRTVIRTLLSPISWVLRFGFGGQTLGQKILRRAWLILFLAVFVGAPLTWAALWMRLCLSRPANRVNRVALANAELQKIPDGDRAWPFYSQALDVLESSGLIRTYQRKGTSRVELQLRAPYLLYLQLAQGPNLQEYEAFGRRQANAIKLVIEGTQRPRMGLELPGPYEAYFDSSQPFPPPLPFEKIDVIRAALRTELFASIARPDGLRPIDVIEACLRFHTHEGELRKPLGMPDNRHLTWLTKDVAFLLIEYPESFTNDDLLRLHAMCETARGVRNDPQAQRLVIENLLDQIYSADSVFTLNGLHLINRELSWATSYSQRRNPTSRHMEWLRPRSGIVRERWRREIVSELVLPIAVLGLPDRESLREQLHASLEKQEASFDLPFKDLKALREEIYRGPEPTWFELPHFALSERFHPCGAGDRLVNFRFRTIVLVVELEMIRRKTGSWPRTLDEIDDALIPRDPYREETPVQYAVRNGKPYVWSIGSDFEDQRGERLDPFRRNGCDWQIIPTEDLPGLVETYRTNK